MQAVSVTMAIGLCIGTFFLIVLIVLSYLDWSSNQVALFESLVIALIIWMSGILIGTEFLGIFHVVAFRPLVLIYTCINGILALWIYHRRHIIKHITFFKFQPDNFSILLITVAIFLIVLSAAMAFFCPPNNPDSLSYHLSRQIYWMQQGSLDHFQTPNDRQIMMPPLSEIVGLHFRILSNGDLWANLPQFMSYILCGIIAALIARELEATGRAQIFAAYLVFTIPMAFHQASNTKNDLFLSMLLLALTWQLIRYIKSSYISMSIWILIGLNLGLLWMVKGTGLLFSIPVVLSFGAVFFYRLGWSSWKPILVISTIAILLSYGHYSRNYRWYGSIFGDIERPGYDLTIKAPNPKSLISNVIRNASLHLGAPLASWNANLYLIVKRIHDWLKIDLNDPRTTYWSSRLIFDIDYAPEKETKAPAPLHLAAAFFVPFIIVAFQRRKYSLQLFYWSLPFFSFILFCLFVKWQPWNSRLQLPVFCLVCPVIAVVFTEVKKGKIITTVMACLLFLTMLPSLNSFSRPVFKSNNIFNSHSDDLQFRYFPEWKLKQIEIYKLIKKLKPSCIQFDLEWAWQYPIQQMILTNGTNPPHFWGQLSPYPSPAPQVVITWSGNSEKSLFDQKSFKNSMIKIEKYHPFIVFVDKSLLSKSQRKFE